MKISRKKFTLIFLVTAFAFQFATNSILGKKIGLFPGDGEWFPGGDSSIGWKNFLATVVYPVKYVLIQPLSFLAQEPDPAPPILVIAFAIYWTVIAWIIYYILKAIKPAKASITGD